VNLAVPDPLVAPPLAAPGAGMRGPDDPTAWQRAWLLAQAAPLPALRSAPLPALQAALAPPLSANRTTGELEPCGVPACPPWAALVTPPVAQPLPGNAGNEEAAAPASLPPQPAAAEGERVPLRVHVERSDGDALRVWLGMDARQPHASQVAGAAAAQLRSLLHEGAPRLLSLVCNGALVYAAGAAAAPRRPSTFNPTGKESP
jgi:hypothetical protein